MRVAVVGGTGRVGAQAVRSLRAAGHDAVVLARSTGVDAFCGLGLDAALSGAQAVVDITTTPAQDRQKTVAFFTTVTGNLLAAEARAGVSHHVLLSVVGAARSPQQPHYAGKLAQEAAALAGPIPTTVVAATQFHDFAGQIIDWTIQNGEAVVAPALVRPVATADVGEYLAEIALGPALGRAPDLAGPYVEDLFDLARRTVAHTGRQVRLIPGWQGMLGPHLAGNVLLPGPDARIAPTSFDEWLATVPRQADADADGGR